MNLAYPMAKETQYDRAIKLAGGQVAWDALPQEAQRAILFGGACQAGGRGPEEAAYDGSRW